MAEPAVLDARHASAEEILDALEMWGQKLGLERIETLLSDLSRPQLAVPCVLVAGTNGKGSVTTMICRVLREAGYRTGAYYSPHLESVEERIRIDGRTISNGQLGEHLRSLVGVSQRRARELPTYFEAMTACAFLEFRRSECDVAVLEVGLGGRLDATNVTDPLLSVITSIALDHTEHLGSTLREIAHEKAGILRSDRPALVWSGGCDEVRSSLEREARQRRSHFEDVHDTVTVRFRGTLDTAADSRRSAPAKSRFDLRTPVRQYGIEAALLGTHQVDNVALSVRACETLCALGYEAIDRRSIEDGIAAARWPGRMEHVVLESGLVILLDGAHNPAGGRALAAFLASSPCSAGEGRIEKNESLALSVDEGSVGRSDSGRSKGAEARARDPLVHGSVVVGGEVDLLFGSLAGKQTKDTLEALAPFVRHVLLTEPDGGPRTLAIDQLEQMAVEVAWPRLVSSPLAVAHWRRALDLALDRAEKSPSRCLVVAGSLYLIGSVRRALRERFGTPVATTELTL